MASAAMMPRSVESAARPFCFPGESFTRVSVKNAVAKEGVYLESLSQATAPRLQSRVGGLRVMKRFEVFANGDKRRTEATGEVADEDAAIAAEKFENFAAAFLARHRGSNNDGFRFASFDFGRVANF